MDARDPMEERPLDAQSGGALAARTDPADVVRDLVVDAVAEIKPRLRGWLHAGASPLAFFSLLVLLTLADSTRARAGVAVFMVSALLLFTTSAIYHTGTWHPRRMRVLKRIDHANIFVLIAGSSTPFATLLLSQEHARLLLAVMWGGALLGVVFKVLWVDAPRWLHVPLYVVLGWAPVVFVDEFVATGHDAALVLAAVGGVLYSIGAVVYGTRWPNPSPSFFGFHEVFHGLTVAAFVAHYVGISLLVLGHG